MLKASSSPAPLTVCSSLPTSSLRFESTTIGVAGLTGLIDKFRIEEARLENTVLDVTSHESGALCGFDAADRALQVYASMAIRINEMDPLYSEMNKTKHWFDLTMQEWGEDIVDETREQINHLSAVMEQYPGHKEAHLLLISMENQLLIFK